MGTASQWSSQNIHNIYGLFAILRGHSSWNPRTVTIVTSKSTVHRSLITVTNMIVMKQFEIL